MEEMGIDTAQIEDHQIDCVIDMKQIESYRKPMNPSTSEPIEEETMVYLRSGYMYCLDVPFEEFDKLFFNYLSYSSKQKSKPIQ